MTAAKPIFFNKPLDPLNQKPQAFSRLSQRELEEVHVSSTHYPHSKESVASHHYSCESSPKDSSDYLEGHYKDQDAADNKDHHEHLPSSSGIAALKPHQPDQLSLPVDFGTLKNDRSMITGDFDISLSMNASSEPTLSKSSTAAFNGVEDQAISSVVSSLLSDNQIKDDFNIDQTEEREDINANRSSDGAQKENAHEAVSKMEEHEGSSSILAKFFMNHNEVASPTGSTSSSQASQSNPIVAALRVTNLLDELTATVSRLRLEGKDNKEMTIQLRRDVLADTNINIVSTSKQMEVSFLTNNATSNLLLTTHLTTLQNHLNALCPGQIVHIQTQLTPSSNSSNLGSDQDHSGDDLASFDQNNRGNFNNDEDAL